MASLPESYMTLNQHGRLNSYITFPPLILYDIKLAWPSWGTFKKDASESLCLQEALKSYKLVFDAVYTPKITRLLREADECGAKIVTGVEMFIGQAYEQYERFTGLPGKFIEHI